MYISEKILNELLEKYLKNGDKVLDESIEEEYLENDILTELEIGIDIPIDDEDENDFEIES